MKNIPHSLLAAALFTVLIGSAGTALADNATATPKVAVQNVSYDFTPFEMRAYHRQTALSASELDQLVGTETLLSLEGKLSLDASESMSMTAQNKTGTHEGASSNNGASSPMTYQAGLMVTADHQKHAVNATAQWLITNFTAKSIYAADGALHFEHAVILHAAKADIIDKSAKGTTFAYAKTPSIEYHGDFQVEFNKRLAMEVASPDGQGYDVIVLSVGEPSHQMLPDGLISETKSSLFDILTE